ncbi:DEAD-box ATP-dependent RNA helicase [Chloropicon primus]|uniref:RNA helicase n=1 Tax=Chloropicon primus TaxID=1764295 RepID=A0A5B8MGV7_9CHLO|nr:DEAD-box ATP-dependent RNA helicase [Chloropicon primus]|eukprot:QDZ19314.1 DEAD-box ATP-dependent RNA helicase [Chloropicon primus]
MKEGGEGQGSGGGAFVDLGLDPRLVKAGEKKGWKRPTSVQAESIPHVLKGKDVVVQAPTGSGKTASYVMPMIDGLLSKNAKGGEGWLALIMVPTRELSEQVREETETFLSFCGAQNLEVTSITSVSPENMSDARIATVGDIIVSTPGQIRLILKHKAISGEDLFSRLRFLVLDEADLLLSYGYEKDVEFFSVHIPQSCQCSMFCATMTDDMEKLNKLVCTNPLVIQVASGTQAQGKGAGNSSLPDSIDHYKSVCTRADKLLSLTCLLKLGLVQKKVLIFVNTIDTGYRVRLFLEHFGIKSAVLNAELPLNSRHNIIKHFNKGNFDFLIATDIDKGNTLPSFDGASEEVDKSGAKGKRQGRTKIDADFGVVRGIDFQGVRTVVNFDMSKTVEGYIHRVGRTGRAGNKGICISLVTEGDTDFLAKLNSVLRGGTGEEVQLVSDEEAVLQNFEALTPSLVDSLRYRGQDVYRAVSRAAVQEARAKELRMEILNSSKLKSHFKANPDDEIVLKHDATLSASVPSHLKHIPKYLKEPSNLLRKKNLRGRAIKKAKHNKNKKKGKSATDILKEAVSSAD